jgi:hypothetical protein
MIASPNFFNDAERLSSKSTSRFKYFPAKSLSERRSITLTLLYEARVVMESVGDNLNISLFLPITVKALNRKNINNKQCLFMENFMVVKKRTAIYREIIIHFPHMVNICGNLYKYAFIYSFSPLFCLHLRSFSKHL